MTCQRPPNNKDKGVKLANMNLKLKEKQSKFPGLPAHSPGSSSRHVLHCWVCSSLINTNKWRSCVTCHVRSFCLFTEARSCKGITRACDATLTLSARMLGGSGIPGEWHCALCSWLWGAGTPKHGASGVGTKPSGE